MWQKKRSYLLEWPQIGKFLGYSANTLINGSLFGIGGAFLVDSVVEAQAYPLHLILLFHTFFWGALFLPLDVFPFYKAQSFEFPEYYPVSSLTKLRINLSVNLYRHFVFFIVLMQVLLVTFSKSIGWFEIGYSTLIIFSFYGLNRILKNTISFKVRHARLLLIAGCISLLISCFIYGQYGAKFWALLISMICFIAISWIYVQSELTKKTKPDVLSKRYFGGLFYRILAQRDVRTLLGIGITFKVIGLAIFSIASNIYGGVLFNQNFIIWIFASPLILFTYLGYNFFGVNRTLFFTHAIRVKSRKKLFKIYADFFLPLLLMDAFIFLIFTTVSELLTIPNIAFYLTCAVVYFLTAFPISLRTPIIKEKYLSLDFMGSGGKNISWTAMITGFAIFLLAYFAKLYWFFLIADIGIIALAFMAFHYLPLNMSLISQNFYEKARSV